ncbi:hypothetical protein SAMN04515619_111131 [Collimonas sp. OK412]|jgi:hypothetical protein|nr:hypothetical protein SAMN04515619_111131 [Collimonas sp. OK412]
MRLRKIASIGELRESRALLVKWTNMASGQHLSPRPSCSGQLMHVCIAAHWDNHDKFRFSTPLGGGFFDSTQWMDDNTRRTFAIRVTAMECERSALFEILADESRKLHLKFFNYIN